MVQTDWGTAGHMPIAYMFAQCACMHEGEKRDGVEDSPDKAKSFVEVQKLTVILKITKIGVLK